VIGFPRKSDAPGMKPGHHKSGALLHSEPKHCISRKLTISERELTDA
jgi:hypothetical protein